MTKTTTSILATAALAMQLTSAIADPIEEVSIRTHPSQGEVVEVNGGTAQMVTGPDGVLVSMQTNGLEPGNAYTLLMAVINSPGQCAALPCTPPEVLGQSDIILSDVAYAGGAIADASGAASFMHHQTLGQFEPGFFENGLIGTEGIEVHLVLNDHGPVIEGRAYEMLTTYRGGCSEDSLPGPMPATARAMGDAGPNICRMVQFAQFIPAQPAS